MNMLMKYSVNGVAWKVLGFAPKIGNRRFFMFLNFTSRYKSSGSHEVNLS